MLRRARHGRCAGDGGTGISQLGRRIGRAADFAVVAVLIRRAAFRAFAPDEAVGEEHLLHGVVELLDGARLDQAGGLEAGVDIFGVAARLLAVGGMVIVEGDAEMGEVAQVFAMGAGNQRLGRQPFFFRPQHDRCAVGVVGADVMHGVAPHALEAHPDVGLDVAHEVAEVDVAVGIGQGAGDENLAGHGEGWGVAGKTGF